jgi:ATP-dependent protease ClpP protease subunit
MIAMNCDDIVVADHIDFMVHTYSTTVQGKGSDLKTFQDHMDKSSKALMNETYAGFLTKSELAKVIRGEEIWLGKAEVLRRWDLRQIYLKEQSNA